MNVKGTKHNHLLQPIVGFIDISTLLILGLLFDLSTPNYKLFAVYITFAWLVTTVGFGFYKVYRFTPFLKILSKIFRQFLLLILCLFTFFGIFNEIDIVVSAVLEYACLVLGIIALIKILIFNLRKKYRKQLGGDTIRVIILGKNPKTEQLKNFFKKLTLI